MFLEPECEAFPLQLNYTVLQFFFLLNLQMDSVMDCIIVSYFDNL